MKDEKDIIDNIFPDTMPELFDARVRQSANAVACSQFDKSLADWQHFTWAQVARCVGRWRTGFQAVGLKTDDRVAILLDNCLEWVCFDQAALSLGLVVVPLYRTDSSESWAYVLSESAPRFLLLSSEDEWRRLRPLRDRFASTECVVSLLSPSGKASDLIGLDQWLPKADLPAKAKVTPNTLATITYTSGTTGRPKGVMLSHGNLISATRAVLRRNRGRSDDVFLAYLPMGHVFERTVEYYAALAAGAHLVFARSMSDLPEDFKSVRPTIMMGVPRIYERAWSAIQQTASRSVLGRFLLRRALVLGQRPSYSLVSRVQCWLISHLLSKRVAEQFGGRLRLAISGSAPLSLEVAEGLRAVGIPIVEGYGLAEAAGPISGDEVSSYVPGSAGRPLDGVEVQIAEDGELLVRAPSVMQGYWKRPADTALSIEPDGWLHTGDLAAVRDGRLFILGRACDVIVTATGEKLAPSDLETRIVSDPLFQQVVVVGDARPFLVALIALQPAQWGEFAKANHLDPALPNEEHAERLLIERIAHQIADFPSYAQIRRLFATLEPWTLEKGLATATMKTKRKSVEKKYGDVVAFLYGEQVSTPTAA